MNRHAVSAALQVGEVLLNFATIELQKALDAIFHNCLQLQV
jgi:hypothetical protein